MSGILERASAEKELHVSNYLSRADKLKVLDLWNKEFPLRLHFQNEEEFDRYIESLDIHNHYLVKDSDQQILAWSMVFNRDFKTWFAVIVDEPFQYQGLGRSLLHSMKKSSNQLNGWVIDHNNDVKANGENYFTKKEFFKKHDFQILDHSRSVSYTHLTLPTKRIV